MIYLIYAVLLGLGAVVTGPYWLVLGIRKRKYLPSYLQRPSLSLPRLPGESRPLWIHAVSVGEVPAARPLADPAERDLTGRRALAVFRMNRGATEAAINLLKPYLV